MGEWRIELQIQTDDPQNEEKAMKYTIQGFCEHLEECGFSVNLAELVKER